MRVIIVGAGEIGYHIAEKLTDESRDVVVIDTNDRRLRQVEEQFDAQFILGNGASPEVLRKAGIEQAHMLIAVSDQDEVNLVACLMAHLANNKPLKIARVRNPDYMGQKFIFEQQKFEFVDVFINPEYEAAVKLDRILSITGAVDYLELAEGKVRLVGFKVRRGSKLDGVKLFNVGKLDPGYRPLIAVIHRKGRMIVPSGADEIRAGDVPYFTVTDDKIIRIQTLCEVDPKPLKQAMISGGTSTGFYLTRLLRQRDVHVKLIEADEQACVRLAEQLDGVTVLSGVGMDVDLLEQENVQAMDAFVAVTRDEEDNVLSSLLAKSKGAPFVAALTNKNEYVRLAGSIGIDVAVSPQMAAVGRILQYVRRGKVLSVQEVSKGAEVIEFEALETSGAVGKPLMKLGLPKGALVVALARGEEAIIPSGETEILPGDRVVAFCSSQALPKVEEMFDVRLKRN